MGGRRSWEKGLGDLSRSLVAFFFLESQQLGLSGPSEPSEGDGGCGGELSEGCGSREGSSSAIETPEAA